MWKTIVAVMGLGLWLWGGSAWTMTAPCKPLPGNEYEKVFCELKRKGKGHTLPNIYEFRKNPPLTQAFLLKKPAERAGIKLVIPSRENRETLRRQKELLLGSDPEATKQVARETLPPSESKTIALPAQTQVKEEQPEQTVQEIIEIVQYSDVLSSCQQRGLAVNCADGHYELLGNLPNPKLSSQALSEGNQLSLPVLESDRQEALPDYLSEAYSVYIEGMMEIGLAASTMTYSKFAQLYQIMQQQGQDFAGRFEVMYTFLKKDKQTIAVSTKREVPEGFALEYCHFLNDKLLACEHKRANYLFAKK